MAKKTKVAKVEAEVAKVEADAKANPGKWAILPESGGEGKVGGGKRMPKVKWANIQEATIILAVGFHRLSLDRKGDKDLIETKADKKMLRLTKTLIDSDEYRALLNYIDYCQFWLARICFHSPFKRGIYWLPTKLVSYVYDKLQEMKVEFDARAAAFAASYKKKIDEAKELLQDQFNPTDYPTLAYVKNSMYIDWRLLEFGVPGTSKIGEVAFEAERSKAATAWREATEECVAALRVAASGVLKKLVASLGEKSNGQKKSLREDSYAEIKEFFDVFSARNVANDQQLAAIVEKARSLLVASKSGKWMEVSDLREETIRDRLRPELERADAEVDKLVTATARRRISFEDD